MPNYFLVLLLAILVVLAYLWFGVRRSVNRDAEGANEFFPDRGVAGEFVTALDDMAEEIIVPARRLERSDEIADRSVRGPGGARKARVTPICQGPETEELGR